MPPASMPPNTPRIDTLRKYGVRRSMPLPTTVQDRETSGISAIKKARPTTPVITLLVSLRRTSPWVSSSRVVGRRTAVDCSRTAMSVRSRVLAAPCDDPPGSQVDNERDDEERETGRDQRADAERVGLGELVGDVGRDRLVPAGPEQGEGVRE